MFLNVLYTLVYVLVRVISYATRGSDIWQSAISVGILLPFVCFCFRNRSAAWMMLVAEFLLDGNGRFFLLHAIALRTWMIFLFLLIWFCDAIVRKKKILSLSPCVVLPLLVLGIATVSALTIGFASHDPHTVVQDAIPFLFMFLLFPACEYGAPPFCHPLGPVLFRAYLMGTFLFSLGTLVLFSSGALHIQGQFYHWFRDIAGGKITDVGAHVFRVVLPEHLLLPAIALFFLAARMKSPEQRSKQWTLFLLAGIPFVMNISRSYTIAFIAGLCTLLLFFPFKRWFKTASQALLILAIAYIVIVSFASRGSIFGITLFHSRFEGILHPTEEVSAATRRELLTPILQKIWTHPIFGTGFGETVTIPNPLTHIAFVTRQFDWGYLEIWTKMGLLGIASTVWLVSALLSEAWKQKNAGMFAGITVFAAMNITMPAIFHVFGVFFFIFCIQQLCAFRNEAKVQVSSDLQHLT